MKYFCAKIYLFAIKTLRCETRELLIFYRKGEEKSPSYTRGYKRNDAVLSGMSMEKYQYIHDRIGGRASSSDVVKEYLRNQGFYDSKDY